MPAFATDDPGCTPGNTVVAGPGDDTALIQAELTAAEPIICLDGTFTISSALAPTSDVVLYGFPAATIDGGGSTQLISAVTSAVTVENLTLRGGSSDSNGGAISALNVVVLNSEFRDNVARGDGGAIYVPGPGQAVVVDNSTFVGNEARFGLADVSTGVDGEVADGVEPASGVSVGGNGGAINSYAVDISNSTFVDNGAAHEGGAVYALGGVIDFTTFLDNTASAPVPTFELPGEALYIEYGGFGGASWLRGNIFAGNTGYPMIGIGGGLAVINDAGGNLFTTTRLTEVDLASPSASTKFGVSKNSIFGAAPGLADNGGSTETVMLAVGSPAIDAVPALGPGSVPDPTGALESAEANDPRDQRGQPRTGLLDAGALEFQPSDAPGSELAATGSDPALIGWLAGIAAVLFGAGAVVVVGARRRARR